MTGKERAAFGMTGGRGGCVRNGRMGGPRNDRIGWRSEWQKLARVVSCEGRNVRSVNGVCAMSLDSSLCSE